MDILQAIFLAFIQGITEFLPISSSAHLILIPQLTAWDDQGLMFDVAVHFGSLFAIVYYFRKDIILLSNDFFASIPRLELLGQAKIAWGILLATIPVAIAGLLFKDIVATDFRSIIVIAYANLYFGILLGIADYINKNKLDTRDSLTWFDIFFIGFAQTLAIIPGTSRSGVAITAGLLIGLSRYMAVKFAFLLAIPVIFLSAILAMFNLTTATESVNYQVLIIGFLVSMFVAYTVIALFMKFITTINLNYFVLYRIILAVILFYIFYSH